MHGKLRDTVNREITVLFECLPFPVGPRQKCHINSFRCTLGCHATVETIATVQTIVFWLNNTMCFP